MAKSKLRLQAREMRRAGLGIKTIANRLNVSSSTTSLWCRDIELTDAQMTKLGKNSRDPYYGKRKDYLLKIKNFQAKKLESIRQKSLEMVGAISSRDVFISGIALYWAEGFKKDKQVGFANTDPVMIRVFIRWLNSCGVGLERLRFRVGINEHYSNKTDDIEDFWVRALKISKKQFQKPFFQKTIWKKEYENPQEYHGVLRVRVTKSLDLLRQIMGWIEGIKLK